MDCSFAAIFSFLLKKLVPLNITLKRLTATLAVTTMVTDLLGFAVGSIMPDADAALATGTPIMIVYMVLGIINPAGASENSTEKLPLFLKVLKVASPIRWAIESLCCGEFRGMKLVRGKGIKMGGLIGINSGDAVLEALGLKNREWIDGIKQLALVGLAELGIASIASYFTQPASSKSTGAGRKTAKRSASNKVKIEAEGPVDVPIIKPTPSSF